MTRISSSEKILLIKSSVKLTRILSRILQNLQSFIYFRYIDDIDMLQIGWFIHFDRVSLIRTHWYSIFSVVFTFIDIPPRHSSQVTLRYRCCQNCPSINGIDPFAFVTIQSGAMRKMISGHPWKFQHQRLSIDDLILYETNPVQFRHNRGY